MTEDPYPASGDDGDEPEDSCPPPGADGPGGEPEGVEQGLFVTLPAEELTLAGFGQGGRADTMPPGPLMAVMVHAGAGEDGGGLKALSDEQLVGVISAARRLEARATWTELAATAEFAARHPAAGPAGSPGGGVSEFAADELAAEFRQPWTSAAAQVGYARAVAARLPRSLAALAAGLIHPVHLRIIEDETRILSDQDAAAADGQLAQAARDKSFGQLRGFARRLVLKLDPGAAARRKEAARRQAHVRRFREDSGNAGMTARELPSAEVLASWQHVGQRARDLRAAGMPGTLQELRVRAYLDLLQERDSRTAPAPAPPPTTRPPPRPAPPGPAPRRRAPAARPSRATAIQPASPAAPARATEPAAPACMTHPAGPARGTYTAGRAWRRWSTSPCRWAPGSGPPPRRGRRPGSACWTPPTPAP